jgi:hypothetical protein
MDTSDQATPTKPTWRARIGTAWHAVKTKAADWWAVADKKALKEAALIVLLVCVLAVPLWFWLQPAADVQPVSDVAPSSGLQDQLETLRLRVDVLEAKAFASDTSPPAIDSAPPAAKRRSAKSATGTSPEPSTPLPTPPAPITRQSIDQFRASLRTSQPDQE